MKSNQSAWAILVTGDIYIPSRASAVPKKIRQRIDAFGITDIVCTGNLTSTAAREQLAEISQNIILSRGPLDDVTALAEDCAEFGSLRVGVMNGASVVPRGDVKELAKHALMMNCHVICVGGELGVERFGDLIIIKSGSLTGVGQDAGFAVITVECGNISVMLCKLTGGKIAVETIDCGKCPCRQHEDIQDKEEHIVVSGDAQEKKVKQFVEEEYCNEFQFDA